MDIYEKDNTLQQIREQIKLNKKNIELKGGNLKKNKNPDIQNIYNIFENEKNENLKVKNELLKHISNLINDLDIKITEPSLINKISEFKHEKEILEKMLINVRSKKFI
tara:strand:+ start:1155 stop:1478 length:324 start_codon:yes stop_codon:yes gene_type:complete